MRKKHKRKKKQGTETDIQKLQKMELSNTDYKTMLTKFKERKHGWKKQKAIEMVISMQKMVKDGRGKDRREIFIV